MRVGQNLLLEVLWETDGLTPGELAGRLAWPPPPWSSRLTGWPPPACWSASRTRADARLVRLYLTDRARSVRRAIEQERDDLERRMTATLTAVPSASTCAAP